MSYIQPFWSKWQCLQFFYLGNFKCKHWTFLLIRLILFGHILGHSLGAQNTSDLQRRHFFNHVIYLYTRKRYLVTIKTMKEVVVYHNIGHGVL